MKSPISLALTCCILIYLIDQCTVIASSDPSAVTPKSVFYDAFSTIPENIDQVIESASTNTDSEPDLAASDEHGEEDESSSKMLKETGHDDKSKKKYKTKKNFYYSEYLICSNDGDLITKIFSFICRQET